MEKRYIAVLDEMACIQLRSMLNLGISFLEVQAMDIDNMPDHRIVVLPKAPPQEQPADAPAEAVADVAAEPEQPSPAAE